ncbi:carbohydrate-binding protein [Streptomyces sp. NA04227]|uniref:endo-alpha-N-acetylgalactosaminidase family protein n=1 Tax=Streptomyces sp. NA04227 TaxID=2742136 RepID=UPI0015918B59|nr:endo-alpha-N-acetylgalactosaminidase family protein [Streptomyces sp. NA04227]QKW07619.1 carbohydrate-binding protein [Streptomyces sp. NA04227]
MQRLSRLAAAAVCAALAVPLHTAASAQTTPRPAATEGSVALSAAHMTVQVDPNFPAVDRYTWKADGSVLHGRTGPTGTLVVNGKTYTPESTGVPGANRVDYTLRVAELDLVIKARLAVSDNVLTFQVTGIEENGEHKLRTLAIPDQGLVSARSDQPGAQLADARLSFTTTYDHEDPIDRHTKLADAAVDAEPRGSTYAILSTDGLAAAVETNSLEDQSRVLIRTSRTGDAKSTALSSGTWTYRPEPVGGHDARPTELPYAKVALTGDRNDDGNVDWQDGAIAYREVMYRPMGAEKTKNFVASNIEYNTNSFASHPFTRVLDDIKKGNRLTDGLGQLVQLKGYQAEGHDNAHPDYGGHINEGAGGRKDLNFLVREAKKYGASMGVHINSTEAYPDADTFRWDMVQGEDKPGWTYRDRSYLINREKDIQSGNFAKRLDTLKKDVPGLEFIYNDVYYGRGYNAYELARTQHERGWMVHTEFEDFVDRDTLWYHRSAQRAENGIRSQIIRFIQNTDRDVWYRKDAKLLKGNGDIGYGGFESHTDLVGWQRTIFTNNLPTKFMQHFPITKWTDHRVDFTDGVYSTDETGTWQLFQGDTKLAEGNKVFLPWDPKKQSKIYHWNDEGGTTTWKLPEKWRDLGTVKLYRLSDTGRQDEKTLKVTNGKVTIDAKARTGYVLYRGKAAQQTTVWGEGALVEDGSFNSHTFDAWSRDGAARIETNDEGWQFVRFDGSGQARLSQQLKGLKPGTYAASAYVRVAGGRKATLSVSDYGGEKVSRSTDVSPAVNKDPVNVWSGTKFQKMNVLFTVPKGHSTATLTLSGAAGASGAAADFADVRVSPSKAPAGADKHYFTEDFEAADRAWGPFVNVEGSGEHNPHGHRAERHENYTRDTISGDYSLKSFQVEQGDAWRSIPQNLEFKPGRTYRVGLKYQSDNNTQYRLQVRSGGAGDKDRTLVDDPLIATTDRPLDSWPKASDPRPDGWNDAAPPQGSAPSKEYATVFSTGDADCGDPYLALTSAGGLGAITVDDLVVDDLGPAPDSGGDCPATGGTDLAIGEVTANPGETTPLTATFTNRADVPVTDVRVELNAPAGVTLKPVSATRAESIAPGDTLKVDYELTLADDLKLGSYAITGEVSSHYRDQRITATAERRVTVNCKPDLRCEAEDVTLGGGTAVETLARGQSGKGYVNFPGGKGGYVEWKVDVADAGDYALAFRYALTTGDRPLTLSVNGKEISTDSYPVTGAWDKWSEAKAKAALKAGSNTIRLTAAKEDGPNVDYLTVVSAS